MGSDAHGECHCRFRLRKNQGEKKLIPANDQAKDRGRGEAGADQRKNDPEQHPESRFTVEQRGFLNLPRQLLNEAAHHPDDERQVQADVDQDQSGESIQQADFAQHQKERNDGHDRRKHTV